MRMPRTLGVVILTLAASAPAAAQSEPTGSVRLVVGEQRTLRPGYAIGDIAIANPSVCDFRVVSNRREILLIAQGEGFTTLTVWDQGGTKRDQIDIDVITREFQRLMADLAELLAPYPGVTIKRLGSRIVLGGTVPTQQALDEIRMLAEAAGDVLVMVTVPGAAQPPAGEPAGGTVTNPAQPATGAAAPPATPTVVRDPATGKVVVEPEPPPPTRKPVPGAAQPVPLPPTGAAPPATPIVPGQPPPMPPVPTEPPPTQVPARPEVSTPEPVPAAPVSQTVTYRVEIYLSPASAPPPEVLGPQGARVQMAQLTTEPGREIRQFLPVGAQPTAAAQAKGVSIALTPEVGDGSIETAVVIDTNLPIGTYDQKTPVWLRARLSFSRKPGETRYITEQELAGLVEPSGGDAAAGGGSSIDGRATADAVAGAVSGAVPGGSYVPAPSSIVRSGGKGQPKPRPTVLVIAVTPLMGGEDGAK